MQDFTAGGIHALPNKLRKSTGNAEIDDRIRALVTDFGCSNSCELIEQLVMTSLKMARDEISVADLKLFNRSLNEMRYAARVFAPYRGHRKVCVFGSARTARTEPEYLAAEEFSRKMVDHEYMIITGGGDGIMGAAQKGAGAADSFGLNIRLPFEQRANETIHGDPKLVNFNYFFTRKLNFVKETHAIALFPGGFGTMDEGFEALTLMQTGKARLIPFVLVDKPGGTYWVTWLSFLKEHLLGLGLISETDFELFHIAPSVDAAVAEIVGYYRVFHSYRWVRHQMVIRLRSGLSESSVERLQNNFADIIESGRFEQRAALPEERNEPELLELQRLVFTPKRRNFGRLRMLINAVNATELE